MTFSFDVNTSLATILSTNITLSSPVTFIDGDNFYTCEEIFWNQTNKNIDSSAFASTYNCNVASTTYTFTCNDVGDAASLFFENMVMGIVLIASLGGLILVIVVAKIGLMSSKDMSQVMNTGSSSSSVAPLSLGVKEIFVITVTLVAVILALLVVAIVFSTLCGL